MADKKPQASKKKKDPPAGAATNARIDKSNRRPSPPRVDTSASPVRPVPVRHRRSTTSASTASLLQLGSNANSLASSLDTKDLDSRNASFDTQLTSFDNSPHSECEPLAEDSGCANTPKAPTAHLPQIGLDDDLALDFNLSFEDFSPDFEMPEIQAGVGLDENLLDETEIAEEEFGPETQLAFNNSPSLEFMLDINSLWSSPARPPWIPGPGSDFYFSFLREPQSDPASDEMLLRRFDKETCGIMSIRHDSVENPWRTLVGPLVSASPVLFHAVCAMAAFHGAKSIPELRQQGILHFNNSLASLRQNVRSLSPETALATSIALAFAESWDSAISTGIDHIKAARNLIQRCWEDIDARKRRGASLPKPELERFKFLCKTWIYIDVIARLTSVDDDVSEDFASCTAMVAMGGEREVDPLMGCASSLFPIIGHVANLVRRVCRLETNSPAMVDQANVLKDALECWRPPSHFSSMNDPNSEVQHSLQTAEAYRWSTLLYLYQAVPELPSPPSSKLGSKVMKYLATVPLSSRTIIVHIYPLLVAGCEANTFEDRNWVSGRWQQMSRLMLIGNIDSCSDVVKEVWRRRDEHAAMKVQGWAVMGHEKRQGLRDDLDLMANLQTNDLISKGARDMIMAHRDFSRPHRPDFSKHRDVDDVMGSMDREYTVRGFLHWVNVMKDWKWEVLLG